jgi:hypothetical protein
LNRVCRNHWREIIYTDLVGIGVCLRGVGRLVGSFALGLSLRLDRLAESVGVATHGGEIGLLLGDIAYCA